MTIRHWLQSDLEELRGMVRDCVRSTSEQGAHVLPTERNVQSMLDIGMQFVAAGDPTLVAVEDGHVVGYVMWGGFPNPFDLDMRMCSGLGTYVVPDRRRAGIASSLRQRAFEIARVRGYKCIEGTAYHEEGKASALAVGFVPTATQVEMRV